MQGSPLWSLILFLHILCMTLWIGGGFYAIYVLRPSLTLLEKTQQASVHLQTLKRFFFLLWHVIPLTLLSGWAMIIHIGGFKNLYWPINAMQGLGLLMGIIFAIMFFGPYKKTRRAIRPQPADFAKIRKLTILNILLGFLTILMAVCSRPF
ncbi:CopD family protein [Entomobacter blattae]|uniref:Copper resistance protein D domain-containing protein n=1 Tax=Entomobacter blattae TaxID=2762277 RepID=A0A7H1NSW2_9PROT|nr:CopD family protein [Entomobacter blattae]QNT78872.1 hypothetical protein JGUZn3_16510 [Entomobacter blattae]